MHTSIGFLEVYSINLKNKKEVNRYIHKKNVYWTQTHTYMKERHDYTYKHRFSRDFPIGKEFSSGVWASWVHRRDCHG